MALHNWDDLHFCLALNRHKTMTKAGNSLSANVATVSRRIEKLTEELGQALFIKHASMWEPTEAGRRLIALAETVEQNLDAFAVQQDIAPPPGALVRAAVTLTILQSALSACGQAFLRQHPDLVLDLTFRDRSIAYAEADVAVTYTRPTQGLLTCRKLGTLRLRPYVCAQLDRPPSGWLTIDYDDAARQVEAFQRGEADLPTRLRLEGLTISQRMLAGSDLVATFPECFADHRPELKRLSPDGPAELLEVWISFHRSRKLDPIVRLADALVTECFGETTA
ncbi:LysR family transcriptional regulator [Roseovarius sp. SYSU LYC5161]|uniref:LysR family transcriptional regulator n=1 Tax=Roseovarius halophilus (ex Wu et al. 2025) TaxID=3376060 RepID=UPI00399ADD2B